MKQKITKRRYFTGKLDDFTDKAERNFWKKNLKAYLKGHAKFKFGRSLVTGDEQWHKVAEAWKETPVS